jgi:hypothetical protein
MGVNCDVFSDGNFSWGAKFQGPGISPLGRVGQLEGKSDRSPKISHSITINRAAEFTRRLLLESLQELD